MPNGDFNKDFSVDFNVNKLDQGTGDFSQDFSIDFNVSNGGSFSSDFSSDFAITKPVRELVVPALTFDLNVPIPIVGTGVNILIQNPLEFTSSFPQDHRFENRIQYVLGPFGPQQYVLNTHAVGLKKGVNINVPSLKFNLIEPEDNRLFQLRTIKFSGGAVPIEHIQDSKKLTADAYVDLFEIALNDNSTIIYMKSNEDKTWQGNTYEGTGIKISGIASHSDDQTARPNLFIANPDGVYSYLIDQGLLDNATITRIRLLKTHLDSDSPISTRKKWRVSRITSLRSQSLTLQLRDMLDGQFFLTPGRMFIPPEFPQVSLQ